MLRGFSTRSARDSWDSFRTQAEAAGLSRIWVVPRSTVESRFSAAGTAVAASANPMKTPAAMHPGYRVSVLLGSPGRAFWSRFRAAAPQSPSIAANSLDRYTEGVVEGLCGQLRQWDRSAVAVYPFRHARQLLGFQWLLGDTPWTRTAPFGVTIDPQYGPWFAWRAAVLTRLAWPASPLPAASPCALCPAPCVAACPSGAVDKAGFDWRTCAAYRLGEETCRESCLARLACPVGSDYRYVDEQFHYHYRASLREIAALQKGP